MQNEKQVPVMQMWVDETHHGVARHGIKVTKSLFSGKSEFQTVDVLDTPGFGKVLLNDGLFMVSDRDEFIYHDMIAHVAMYTHPNPKNVLVIGGGDGGTAREVLRHPGVEECVMVEIDEMVVNACKEHIPVTSVVFDHPKLDLKIEDAVKYVAETNKKFDVILVDSTDPIGPATPLFGPEFYQNLYNCLNEDGIVVSQGESPFFEQETQISLLKIISEIFPKLGVLNFSNLTYPGGLWSFTFASKKYSPLKDFQEDRYKKDNLKFKYYNKEIHKACFALPQFMRDALGEYLKGI